MLAHKIIYNQWFYKITRLTVLQHMWLSQYSKIQHCKDSTSQRSRIYLMRGCWQEHHGRQQHTGSHCMSLLPHRHACVTWANTTPTCWYGDRSTPLNADTSCHLCRLLHTACTQNMHAMVPLQITKPFCIVIVNATN